MFKRKIMLALEQWKAAAGHSPLLIKGLRQIGKTSIACEFAKTHYGNAFILDFRKDPRLATFFEGDFDIDMIAGFISSLPRQYRLIPDSKLVPNDTVFIFDEVQDCPNARSSLKYFKLDGRYDVICTGSLLGLSGYRLDSSFPRGIGVGFETHLTMQAMDFEEFAWACSSNGDLLALAKKAWDEKKPVHPFVHDGLVKLLREYICVGGMPEAVDAYVKGNKDMQAARMTQKKLVDGFKADFGIHLNRQSQIVYDDLEKGKLMSVFDSIPLQLSKENKKFMYRLIEGKKGGAERYGGAIDWLKGYGLIDLCHNVTNVDLPLPLFEEKSQFKVYFADIGIFTYMLGEEAYTPILTGDLSIAKGAVYESLVADALLKSGRGLHYFAKGDSLEIDFLSSFGNKLYLTEVKAQDGNAKAAKTVLANPKYHADGILKLDERNIGVSDRAITAPYYLASYIFGGSQ